MAPHTKIGIKIQAIYLTVAALRCSSKQRQAIIAMKSRIMITVNTWTTTPRIHF